MPSRKLFGFEFFWVLWNFQSLVPFLSSLIIRPDARFPIRQQSQHARNTLISGTTLFIPWYKKVLSRLFGYLQKTCLQIFLLSLSLLLFFLDIAVLYTAPHSPADSCRLLQCHKSHIAGVCRSLQDSCKSGRVCRSLQDSCKSGRVCRSHAGVCRSLQESCRSLPESAGVCRSHADTRI